MGQAFSALHGQIPIPRREWERVSPYPKPSPGTSPPSPASAKPDAARPRLNGLARAMPAVLTYKAKWLQKKHWHNNRNLQLAGCAGTETAKPCGREGAAPTMVPTKHPQAVTTKRGHLFCL